MIGHAADTSTDVLRLPDGRCLQWWDGGAPGGTPVFFLHGCPDTRHAAYAGDAVARRIGVRLLAVNRPGYGRSDPHASTHLTVADDLIAVADQLGIGTFSLLGMSIGGPYALACAARHPQRVAAAAVAAAPASVPELDPPIHRDDLDADGREFFVRLSRLDPEAAVDFIRPGFAEYVAQLNPADPDDAALVRRFLAQLDPRDAELTTRAGPPVEGRPLGSTAAIAAAIREALANPDGYLRDAAISFRSWEFRPEQVSCPVFLWYGDLDSNAAPRNGEWLAARLPQATLVVHEQTTHLAVLHDHWGDVLTTLKSGAESRRPG